VSSIDSPNKRQVLYDYQAANDSSPSPSKIQNPSIGVSIRSQTTAPAGGTVFRADSSNNPTTSEYQFRLNRVKKGKVARKGGSIEEDSYGQINQSRGTAIVNI